MRAQHVSIIPSDSAKKANRIALTPELLAATGARYSRSNEGLDAIVSRIDWKNTDKSVDAIFRMVDYGHASIADMAPVAMFIDEISIFAAYYLWSVCPTASGQESSTRYIKLERSGVMTPGELGIKAKKEYYKHIDSSFDHYNKALDVWLEIATKNPKVMNIPDDVVNDKSEKGMKKLERMKRNYAFDRARVYLPVSAKTNVMLVMTARNWVDLVSNLLSHSLKELNAIGEKAKVELGLVTPRLIKHAVYKEDVAKTLKESFSKTKKYKYSKTKNDDQAFLRLYGASECNYLLDLSNRMNRYSPCGDVVRMTPVTFGWGQIAFAEIRDLNRHRTGQKMMVLKPNSFHDASDQTNDRVFKKKLSQLSLFGLSSMKKSLTLLKDGDPTYFYYTLLGHNYAFSHTTTLDKYIYEAELRTGIGAHYKYADHLKNTLKILYKLHPELKGLIKEGGAEPE